MQFSLLAQPFKITALTVRARWVSAVLLMLAFLQPLVTNPALGGAVWQEVLVPGLPADAATGIGQIWTGSPGDVYVWFRSESENEAQLMHWDGAAWAPVLRLPGRCPAPGGIFGTGPEDVFAAVTSCDGAVAEIWHFDGAGWSNQPLPAGVTGSYFGELSGRLNDVYVRGCNHLLHYDGVSWSIVNPGLCWGGGSAYVGPSEIYMTTCGAHLLWDGSSWALHGGAVGCDVNGAWGMRDAAGTLHLYATGNNNFSNGIKIWRFVESFPGSMTGTWSQILSDPPGGGARTGSGRAIWGSGPDDIYVAGFVGWGDTHGRLHHFDGASWQPIPEAGAYPYAQAVHGSGPFDVWVALDGNRLLHRFATYTITATSDPHGTISPAGAVTVSHGGTQSFAVTPAPGYLVADVRVDGVSVGPVEHYTFTNVTADHTVAASFALRIAFDFKPHDLHLNSKGKWVTGYLRPPVPYLASQIDVSSVRLNGVVLVSTEHPARIEDHDSRLKVKFLRSEVKPTLTPGDHVAMTVTGMIAGQAFIGADYIKVKAPKVHHPAAGDILAAGTTTEVAWDLPELPASTVTLLSSFDDGVTWRVEAQGIANTGSYAWAVPEAATRHGRLAIVDIYDTDETGVVPESEFAESDRFSITATTNVDGNQATFALRPSNPVIGPLAVSFSLANAAEATLAVYDVVGRLVISRDVSSRGPGWHTMMLGDLPAGVYVVRLSQSRSTLTSRVAVIR